MLSMTGSWRFGVAHLAEAGVVLAAGLLLVTRSSAIAKRMAEEGRPRP